MCIKWLGVLAGAVLIWLPPAVLAVAAAPAAAQPPPVAAADAGEADKPAQPTLIQFNFKGATFDQVLDFFARATGRPIVREADVPEGTLDYLSPESYNLAEALRVLNIILQSKGVMLRVEQDMLYLQRLTEMQRENVPTYVGELPEEVTSDQIVTVVRPLSIALAKPMAERLKTMVAAYGSVAAMEQQNALVITETAAQIRRLLRIIEELDREDPEGAIEIFAIRHTKASNLMEPLKALLAHRVEKYVIDKDGKQTKIEEDQLPGLSITFDERTNSIIAKGVQNRLDKLREAIELLDVPATDGGRTIRTVVLATLSATQAAARLTELYSSLPEDRRPAILPLEDTGKVTIVGNESAIAEGLSLLKEIDGGGTDDEDDPRVMRVLPLEHAPPQGLITALQSVLNGRQLGATKLVPGPDGRSIIVAGTPRDVTAVADVVEIFDRPPKPQRQVRLVRLSAVDPPAAVARALDLYEQEIAGEADPSLQISAELDPDTRQLTLVGGPGALDRFAEILRMVETSTVIERETRQLVLAHARPGEVAVPMTALARQLLAPRDDRPFVEPLIEPVDELDVLIVTAAPEQFAVLESLVETLDRIDPADHQFRVVPLAGVASIEALLQRADEAYGHMVRSLGDDAPPPPETRVDPVSGSLIVSGRGEAVARFEQALGEARRLLPPARTGRLFPLRQARASEVIEPLRTLLEQTAPHDVGRQVPAPRIEVIEPTNSLYVVAEPVQHQMLEQFIRELDTVEQTELPPLRLLQVRAADSAQLAQLLTRRYDARPADQRREQPVSVTADAATNTMVVVAHKDVYEEIREFVDTVNRAGEASAERETMLFPLKRARAVDVSQALEKLYPEPPMPLDRRGRPLPHLREPREVHVSADAATNTLIVEAPVERRESFQQLVEQLDRVELPPTAELRTYHIERGDPAQIARTLTELARRGVLSAAPEDGGKPVEVTIQAEPLSRTLIVAGDEVTFAQTEQMLSDLQAVPVQRSLMVFDVSGTDPQSIADRAQRLYEQQTVDVPEATAVSVEIDRENSTLLVVADDEAMVRIRSILNELMQTVSPPPDVRLVALQYADAEEVVAFLDDLAGRETSLLSPRSGPPPVFQMVQRTNSILVAAQSEQHAVIQSLIRSLDIVENREMPPLRILQLRTADAQNLADALMRQYAQRSVEQRNAKPVNISADPQTNSLIVAAHPEALPEVQAIVSELNDTRRLDAEGREIRIFPLKVARAEELARTIDEMFPEPPVPVDRRGRPMHHLRQPREVVVRADDQTNSLIVDAPIQRMAGFETLVEQLDRQQPSEDTEIRTYPVVHADLQRLAETLKQLAAGGALSPAGRDRRVPVTVATEPVSQTLIVSGPLDVFDRVEQVLEEMDARRTGPTTTLRFFKLSSARAESVAAMLREVLLSRIAEDVPDAGADVQALLQVTADRKTNTLIIAAPAAVLPVAEELIEQLDDGSALLGDPVVRVRPLTFADAQEVSTSLTTALAGMISPVSGEAMDVRLIPSPGSNALIIVGPEAELAEVEKLVEPLDARPATDAIDARTFPLTRADATRVAPIVERLLTDQQQTDPRIIMERIRRSRGQVDLTPPIRVEADARSNSLIVSGPQRTVALASTLIEQLDRPGEQADRDFELFTPRNAEPAALAATVEQVLRSTVADGARYALELVPEPQSGTIVVVGRPEERRAALQLLEQWDESALSPPQIDLRIVDLEHSEAGVVAAAVRPLLADRTRWPEELRAAGRAGLAISEPTVTADPAANRLLLSAPAALMPVAGHLIRELDRPRRGHETLDVRIIHLAQAEADQVATAVRSAFSARRAAEPGRPAPTIEAEPSSNSLVVTAPPAEMAEIESIIGALDEGVGSDQPQVRTVFLKHARAEHVAPIVEQMLVGEQVPIWLRFEAARRNRPVPDAGPDVRVAADARLNAVVIAAPLGVLNIAEQMAGQLDVPPEEMAGAAGQRAVQVLVVENADATELATNLEALFAEPDQAGAPPTIRVDGASNSLIVRATPGQFRTIQEVVGRIDRATITTSRQMRLIPIDPSRASAEDVARALQEMLDRGGGSGVQVIPLEELIRRRQVPPEPAESPSSIDDASSRLDPMPLGPWWSPVPLLAIGQVAADAPDDDNDNDNDNGDGVGLTIAVDPQTNSLVVVGSPRAVERVENLVGQIQQQMPAVPGTVRYIGLPEAVNAQGLARLVSQTLSQMTPPGGQRGGFRQRVAVLADSAANALVIVANDADFQTVGDLVAALSQPAATEEVLVKVYPLRTVTAERAVANVQALIQGTDQRGRRPRDRQAQRMRRLAVTLLAQGQSIDAVFSPERVRVSSDAQTNSMIVMAPPQAMSFMDKFVELIDQTPVNVQTTLKLYPLQHARADELQGTLRRIFRARFRSQRGRQGTVAIEPELAVDTRTNTLLVTAAPEALAEIDALLDRLDRTLGDDLYPLRIIELQAASPGRAAELLDRVVIGADQKRRAATLIVPDDNSGLLLVRADEEVGAEIDTVLAEIDRDASRQFEIRTITLERAHASAVATALQRFFDDRARIASAGRGRRERSRRVSIIGDETSNTLLVAASDEDYASIEQIVTQLDSPQAVGALTYQVFQLQHARAKEVEEVVQSLVNDLLWGQEIFFFFGQRRDRPSQREDQVAVRALERINALIVTGAGDKFELVQGLIDVLDAPPSPGTQRLVRLYRVRHADLKLVADLVEEVYGEGSSSRRWWEPPDPNELKLRVDERTNTIVVAASGRQHEEIAALIESIDGEATPIDQQTQVVSIAYARADELAGTLQRFLEDRARATNAPPPGITIIPSGSTNSLVISATAEELATIRDLLASLDQPDVSGDRVIEIVALQEGDAQEIGRIVREQFSRRTGQGAVVTADARTNSIIINAPREQFAQAKALIDRLDAPSAADETIIRTYTLESARAEEAVRLLRETLQLDQRGQTRGITIKLDEIEGPAVEVVATIAADRRSNSLIVTATEPSFPVIEALLRKVDQVPAVSPQAWHIVTLEHAKAYDVYYTLNQFLRTRARDSDEPDARIDYNRLENQLIIAATADQYEQIQEILQRIDVPTQRRQITEFVPLQFAEAVKVQEALSFFYGEWAVGAETPAAENVVIVADPATNSLVIAAEESQWPSIRSLLAELDNEEYDASLQLKVLPLTYADAASVARAINEAFQGRLDRERRGDRGEERGGRDRGRGADQRPELDVPTVLVEAEEWVRASAEPQTNSVVISASRPNIRKIEQIIEQLDVADYAKLPPPQLIPVTGGDPVRLAGSLQQLYEQAAGGRGRRAVRIVGDQASSTIIVRCEEEDFRQIEALAGALQQEAATKGLSVHVIQLESAPARRVAEAVRQAFQAQARQASQPLSIEVDLAGNSLVVACTGDMLEQISRTVSELDQLSPAAGQGIFIIELEHVAPDAAIEVIQSIGLDRPPREDAVARLVTEPITAAPMRDRNAIVIVANPVDRDTVVGLLKVIDAEPQLALTQVRVVPLRNARADALARILTEVFTPGEQQSGTALARAIQEQVRRLAVRRDGLDEPDLRLDLTRPIKIVPDPDLNALVISSTESNVRALEALIGMFDALPITDAVTVQLFPLQNIAAAQFARIVEDLFNQGKRLGTVPGTDLEGMPLGAVGKALLDEVAISVDERTNTVVVAGKEDVVALVEVLTQRLDSDVAAGWVEPRILQLRYADAGTLAELLEAVLVDGSSTLDQASAIQQQVARLRMARADENGGKVLESDVFQPMTRLLIRAEPQLNALVLVGTPMNLEIVTELVRMFDIEAASPSAVVRVYPVQNASAARLATTITRLFDQQVESKAIRPEDRVIVQGDERTNALIVTTSTRSFTVLESLLEMLDAEIAPDLREIRNIELSNASSARLAPLIQELMDARLDRLRNVQPETADLEMATIIADPRTNSLIIAAGNESFEVIRRLAEELDRAGLADASLVDVITVTTVNIERLAETIDQIMERRYADVPADVRRSQRPLVLTDPRTSSLLVAANPEDLAAIGNLVARLEAAPTNPAVDLHVIPLDTAQAERLAPQLQRLMRERQQSLGEAQTPSDRVSIEPDTASNSLVVAASEENLQVIAGLIEALTRAESEAAGEGAVEVIQVVRSRAVEIVDLVEELYVDEENRRRGEGTIRLTADERANAVLVHAPAEDVEAIRGLVARLDGARPATVVEIKYIPLSSANCLETVSLIENVLSGRGIGARRNRRQATVLKYLREIVDDGDDGQLSEMEVSAAIRESITLTPDVRTNTIIVSAPRESMEMIERMIRDMDTSSVGSQSIRIFKLVNADASAMAQILTELFSLTRQGNLYVLKPREAMPGMGEVPGPAGGLDLEEGLGYGPLGTELTAVPDERQQLSITVDSRTNSLLVSGTPTYLDLVSDVVEELDALEANERSVFVYPLRNSTAADVARVVRDFIDTEQEKLISTLGVDQIGSAARLLEREVTIVDDTKSNSVLVSVSPRYEERVRTIIEELDVDPPQVLIQVLLAEVSLDSTDQWGVDTEFGFSIGSADITGGYGLASAFVSGLGVPNISIASSDFNLLINALRAQGRLTVLSNPSVMVANNEQARIQVGETIRVPESVSFDIGSQQSAVVAEDIGIILSVTPSINPDGFVRMNVQPEISELSEETTQISEDFESPIIRRRNADTTVTVKDGQTIVIGGLISDRYERIERMVPFFGELPIVGPLFRSDRTVIEQRELLIVLTPYVIQSPAEVDILTEREVQRLSVPEEVKEQIRRSMIEGLLFDADGNPIRRGPDDPEAQGYIGGGFDR